LTKNDNLTELAKGKKLSEPKPVMAVGQFSFLPLPLLHV